MRPCNTCLKPISTSSHLYMIRLLALGYSSGLSVVLARVAEQAGFTEQGAIELLRGIDDEIRATTRNSSPLSGDGALESEDDWDAFLPHLEDSLLDHQIETLDTWDPERILRKSSPSPGVYLILLGLSSEPGSLYSFTSDDVKRVASVVFYDGILTCVSPGASISEANCAGLASVVMKSKFALAVFIYGVLAADVDAGVSVLRGLMGPDVSEEWKGALLRMQKMTFQEFYPRFERLIPRLAHQGDPVATLRDALATASSHFPSPLS